MARAKPALTANLRGINLCVRLPIEMRPLLQLEAKADALFLSAASSKDAVALRSEIWLSSKFQKTEDISVKFNYAAERNRFEEKWKKLRVEYAEAGMPQEHIEIMYQFDHAQFNSDRAFENHICPLSLASHPDAEPADGEKVISQQNADRLTTEYDAHGGHSRFWWVEEIESPRLLRGLRKLSQEDIEFLTLLFIEGYSQEECAVRMHSSQSAISRRYKRIMGVFTEK